MENRTNTITTTAETLTVNEVMDMIASTSCQRTLMKDIHFINYKYGGKLSKEELKEILATTTFKSLNAAGSFDSSKASIRTWLNSIARNEISRFLKEKRRSEARSIPYVDESDEEGNFPDEIRQMHYRLDASDVQSTGIMGKERARESLLKVQCIKEVIKSMKPEDQMMIKMLIKGFSRTEMADFLNIEENYARQKVHRARRKFKKLLAEAHYADIAERNSAVR